MGGVSMDHAVFSVELGAQQLRLQPGKGKLEQRYHWHSQRHCHGEYELHILLSGNARVEVGDVTHKLSAGMGILIAPGQYHSPMGEGPLERFSLLLSVPEGALLQQLRGHVEKSCIFPVSEEICRGCGDYFYEAEAKNAYRREAQQAILTRLLIGVFRGIGMRPLGATAGEPMQHMARGAFIDDYFEKHIAAEGSKEELARQLYLSQRQLARLLQREYGMGYQEKLISARMDYAALLLRSTDQTVLQIADQVGYRSESAFYRVFSRQYGMTPKAYRKANRQKKEETP